MEVGGQLRPPGRLIPQRKIPRYPLDMRLGPRAGLNGVAKRKIPSPLPPPRESNPNHLIVQPVASRYTDWAIPALTEDQY
jgi:hypothetical protein